MLSRHREQVAVERLKLASHRKKCKDKPEKYLGLVIDGMDQKKTRLPHFRRTPKSVDDVCFIQMHVVGCLIFNGDLKSQVFLNYPNLHNDGNLIVTIIHRIIINWEGDLPPVLYLQLDNTTRENKNNLLFAYLNLLVKKKYSKRLRSGFFLLGILMTR